MLSLNSDRDGCTGFDSGCPGKKKWARSNDLEERSTLNTHTAVSGQISLSCHHLPSLPPQGNRGPKARCPARRMLVNAREWRNNSSWSGVAYTTSGSKARSNARWRGRSLAFKTRWRICFSGFRTSRSPSFVFMKTFSLFFFFFFWQTEHVQL